MEGRKVATGCPKLEVLGRLMDCECKNKVFSLGCFWGVLHPLIVQIYPPISVSEAATPPIRVMACKADLHSLIITKPLFTCKYTAIDCTICSWRIGAGFETSTLDFMCTPYFKILVRTL